jgi:hypothetical protein
MASFKYYLTVSFGQTNRSVLRYTDIPFVTLLINRKKNADWQWDERSLDAMNVTNWLRKRAVCQNKGSDPISIDMQCSR